LVGDHGQHGGERRTQQEQRAVRDSMKIAGQRETNGSPLPRQNS